MADDITKKLDELRRQATERLHDARAIVSQMNTVETLFDLELTKLEDLETAALGTPSTGTLTVALSGVEGRGQVGQVQPAKRRQNAAIRPDEFFGVEPMEAAKTFMRSVGHAVSFDEITDAVHKGGAAIKGADWRERLEISLKRSPYQVITVADKTYGLAEFYSEEQLKRFRGSRRSEPESGTKKKAKSKGGWPKGKARGVKPTPARAAAKKKSEAAPTAEADDRTGTVEPVH